MTGVQTCALPISLIPEPPAIKALEALRPEYQGPAKRLLERLNRALAPIGWEARVTETERTEERQRFLYGIGRLYRAPGRTGTVTDIPNARGPHPQKRALDLAYVPKPRAAPWKEARARIAAVAAELAARTDGERVKWGGTFKLKNGSTDDPHWEYPA